MASDIEVHILSLIESSSDAGEVLSSVSAYLRPFSGLLTCREEDRTIAVRSIAKQFVPFLTKSVSFLQKRLSVTGPAHESPGDLFRAYDFCLECWELVSHDPHAVQLQRIGLIHCYQTWGWFTHAYNDGFRVLEQLRGPESRCVQFLQNPEFERAKRAKVFLEVVASIVRSVAMSRDMDERQYWRVSSLPREIKPWLRYLDANSQDKFVTLLLSDLGKCALSIIKEAERFDEDFVHSFCISTLEEYSASPLPKCHFYKFSRQVLSLLFLCNETKTSPTVEIVRSVLRTVACEFQVEPKQNWLELVDLVSYCVRKSQLAGDVWCAGVSKQLSEIAAIFSEAIPQANVILRLYSAGLSVNVFDVKFRENGNETMESWGLQALLGDEDVWKSLVSLLGMIDQYSDNEATSNDGNKNSEGQTNVSCKHKGTMCMEYTLPYLDALKLLCQPLASLINFEDRKMVPEREFACYTAHLSVIQDMFLQFFHGLRFLQRWTPDKECSGTDFDKTLLNVAMAAFIISMRTQRKVEITNRLVEDVITSPWISPPELKYLYASFHDIGVGLYSIKHLKKASMAFKLCIRTVWTCVRLLCQIYVNEANPSEDCLSGEAIIGFVSEACSKSAFYMDVLQQHGARETEKLLVFILENWSAAEDLIKRLPDPTPIIKQWVKIQRRHHESRDLAGSCTPLHSLLLSSQKISKRVTRKILEQELLAYEEILPLRSELCRAKHTQIADILLKEVFITKDLAVERARILIWKARVRRASGTEHLKECIHYLSEAIFISGNILNEPNNHGTLCCHQLAVAYCLRALCIQETEPDSKQVFQDVNTSLNFWLRIQTPCDSKDSIPLENTIHLLCNVNDLLSIKGWIELQQHIYELIFRLCKGKNVKLEVCLAMLWDCRRLSHALCPSPINDAVILGLSKYFGEKSESTDFWISCLQFSKAKSIGFQLSLQCLPYETLHTLNKPEDPHKPDITVDDVNNTASKLVSSDPLPSHSSFVAASLYYDLCERQLSCGNLYEALSYAKEAHRIRRLIFKDKYSYVAEKHFEKHNRSGKIIGIPSYIISKFEVSSLGAADVWPCGNFLWDINRCYLNPWIVLQCYLESILQVGVINEIIGEGVEAECFLSWGKAISCTQSLQPFVVAFSLALGNLYKRMQSLELAAKELQNVKELLIDSQRGFSCRNCRSMLEVTLDKQLGDLSQRRYDNTTRICQIDGLSHAESLFGAALRKFCCSAWKGCVNFHVKEFAEVRELGNSCNEFLGHQTEKPDPGIKDKPTDNRDSKRRRRGAITLQACLTKEHNLTSMPSIRLTRSMCRSHKERGQKVSADMHRGSTLKKRSFSDESDSFDIFEEKELLLGTENTICSICICIDRKCQQCLSNEVTRPGSLKNLISLKWQFHQRRLACTVLDNLGKCLAKSGKVHQAHVAILRSIAILFNSDRSSPSSHSLCLLLNFIGKEIKGDVFCVDRARLLYNLCKSSLRTYHSRASRSFCCELSHIPSQKLVSWLTLAFVLSREVPILHQKISRLLAALYLLSSSSADFSFPCDGELSVSHWVTYFHQASLGGHINCQFLSNFSRRYKSGSNSDKEASRLSCMASPEFDFLRLAPERTEDLVKFAKNFFNSLSETAVICISLLGGTLSKLLEEIMRSPPVCAWLLLSRLSAKNQPVAVLVPVDSVLEEDDSNPNDTEANGIEEMGKQWACPWGSTVVDVVAPAFKLIMEENFITGSEFSVEDVNLRWKKREELNLRLAKFLRKLEDFWLGPWRHLLLGESSNRKLHESTQKTLVKELRSKCKMEVNETLLKFFLGKNEFEGEAWISQLCQKNGCCIGQISHIDIEDGFAISTSTSNDPQSRYGLALQLIREAEIKLRQQENNEKKEPIILVLDHEIQMLPWENIPILRRQEVYRMPSVGSISAVLKKCCSREVPAGCFSSPFPLIDPRDAYYLLNPGGDLRSTQIEFESWFKEKKMEGRAGLVPPAKELTDALEKHDLFIYFGHGTGEQYIPMCQVEYLDNCAATFLMGCSSGLPYVRGRYVPRSIPLSFLLAGSPVIVANLWGVTNDINRFGKAMLESWLRERSDDNTSERVGSFMADARDACTMQFLTGAAP
ncbi:hypothetical protein EUTSA_v10029518mg, partial [Eutrema salsugineum]